MVEGKPLDNIIISLDMIVSLVREVFISWRPMPGREMMEVPRTIAMMERRRQAMVARVQGMKWWSGLTLGVQHFRRLFRTISIRETVDPHPLCLGRTFWNVPIRPRYISGEIMILQKVWCLQHQ